MPVSKISNMTTLTKKKNSGSGKKIVYSIEKFRSLKPNKKNYIDLEEYISDILESIREELSNRTAWAHGGGFKPMGGEDDWRTRKNPKFMENFTDEDRDKLSINLELNKVSINNYEKIYQTLIEKLDAVAEDESTTVLKNTFEQLFIKSYHQPSVISANVKLIKMLKDNDNYSDVCNDIVDKIIEDFNKLLISSEEHIENELSKHLKDPSSYINVGRLFNCLLCEGIYSKEYFNTGLNGVIDKTLVMIDWESEKSAIEKNINLIVGMLTECNAVKTVLSNNNYRNIEARIRMLVSNKKIDKTFKFRLMDIQDSF